MKNLLALAFRPAYRYSVKRKKTFKTKILDKTPWNSWKGYMPMSAAAKLSELGRQTGFYRRELALM